MVNHKTIGYCINYDPQHTQRHIDRRKESPMSCPRIMETFPELAATLPCNCKFRLPPRSYPSPVLYLIEAEMEAAGAGPPPPDKQEGGQDPMKEDPMKDPQQAEDQSEARDDTRESAPELVLDFERIFSSEFMEDTEGGEPQKPPEEPSAHHTISGIAPEESPSPEQPFPLENGRDEAVENGEATEIDESQSRDAAQCALPEVHAGDPPATNTDGQDAWELLIEYLSLKVAHEKLSRDLQGITMRLDRLFDEMGTEVIETRTGAIRRLQGADGENEWVLTVRACSGIRGVLPR